MKKKTRWMPAKRGFKPVVGSWTKIGKRMVGMETHSVHGEIIKIDARGNYLVEYTE